MMKVYVLVSSPYHENERIIGVFRSLESAKSCFGMEGITWEDAVDLENHYSRGLERSCVSVWRQSATDYPAKSKFQEAVARFSSRYESAEEFRIWEFDLQEEVMP